MSTPVARNTQGETILQRFVTNEGRALIPLLTHTAEDPTIRFIYWEDILNAFKDVSHLENTYGNVYVYGGRALFLVDKDYELIAYILAAYTVVLRYPAEHTAFARNPEQLDNDHPKYGHKAKMWSSIKALASNATSSMKTKKEKPWETIQRDISVSLEQYKHMVELLGQRASSSRSHFLKVLANANLHRDHLWTIIAMAQNNRNTVIGEIIEIVSSAATHLTQLQNEAHRLDVYNKGRVMLSELGHPLSFAKPRLFIVLPANLDLWNDLDPSTHRFRLYFMCDFQQGEVIDGKYYLKPISNVYPQHTHLSSHQGYDIERPQELFHAYGDYILTLLAMVLYGHCDENSFVPTFENFQILSCCSGDTPRHNLTWENLDLLIAKSIEYIQQLAPPRRLWFSGLTADETRHLQTFLTIPSGDNGYGGFHWTAFKSSALWLCPQHSYEEQDIVEICQWVYPRNGWVDMSVGTARLDIWSVNEAKETAWVLQQTECIFDLTISISWDASYQELQSIVAHMAEGGLRTLQIEGVKSYLTPWCPAAYNNDIFVEAMNDTKLQVITLTNFPRMDKQYTYLGSSTGRFYGFLTSPTQSRIDLDWNILQFYLDERMSTDILLRRGNLTKDDQMPFQSLTCHLIPRTKSEHVGIDLFRHNGYVTPNDSLRSAWKGNIEVIDGELHKLVEFAILDHGSYGARMSHKYTELRRLVAINNVLRHDDDFCSLLTKNMALEKVELVTQERDLLRQIEDICGKWIGNKKSLEVTLLERGRGPEGHLVAVLDMKRVKGRPAVVDVRHWDNDHISQVLADRDVAILSTVALRFPQALKSLTIDISSLSIQAIEDITAVVGYATLDRLHIKCQMLTQDRHEHARRVLDSVKWSEVKALVLSGCQIDEWIHLWSSDKALSPWAVGSSSSGGLALLSLVVQGTGIADQLLSHASVLALHWMIYQADLLQELRLENVAFENKADQDLLQLSH
ncbi:hypothetical protein BGZ94_002534 [Podila epigama]|nr:hypothetical protein BGZ94_002534 [Podila epigama]